MPCAGIWNARHNRYNELWKRYPTDKLNHSLHALRTALGTDTINAEQLLQALTHEERIQRNIGEQVYLTRKKDHNNPFRSSTSRNEEETIAIYGTAEENKFITLMQEETSAKIGEITKLKEELQKIL